MSKFREPVADRILRFRKSKANRDALKKVLADPVAKEAMALLRELYLPGGTVVPADSAALALALRYTEQAGAHAYEAKLFSMCDEPEATETPPPVPELLTDGDDVPKDFRRPHSK